MLCNLEVFFCYFLFEWVGLLITGTYTVAILYFTNTTKTEGMLHPSWAFCLDNVAIWLVRRRLNCKNFPQTPTKKKAIKSKRFIVKRAKLRNSEVSHSVVCNSWQPNGFKFKKPVSNISHVNEHRWHEIGNRFTRNIKKNNLKTAIRKNHMHVVGQLSYQMYEMPWIFRTSPCISIPNIRFSQNASMYNLLSSTIELFLLVASFKRLPQLPSHL